MIDFVTSQVKPAPRRSLLKATLAFSAAAWFLACPACVWASVLIAPNCSAGSSSPSCDLSGLLRLLYVVAGVLLFVLLVVIAIAVHAWRKTKTQEITR